MKIKVQTHTQQKDQHVSIACLDSFFKQMMAEIQANRFHYVVLLFRRFQFLKFKSDNYTFLVLLYSMLLNTLIPPHIYRQNV